jgi:hypothetical protein
MDCKYFKNCSAPMCPEDQKNTFYPNDEICMRKDYQKLTAVKNQKKIRSRTKDKDRYFTYEMLDRDIIIRTGISGINPDRDDEDSQIENWLKQHKPGGNRHPEIYRLSEKKPVQRVLLEGKLSKVV